MWFFEFVVGLILLYPIWRIFQRAGLHPAWSLFVLLPGIGLLIVLAVLAVQPWPRAEPRL